MIVCRNCGKLKPHNAFGLCGNCYKKQNLKVCKICGEKKPHEAKGLCKNCYQRQNLIICSSCGKLKPYYTSKKICKTCSSHKMEKNRPFNENKSCTLFLGIHVAEKVLSKVFKNVQQMLPNNPGFDFKCNKGMKIDVKSSVLNVDKRRPNDKGYWSFYIKKNIIPDYFLCIAFDNRTSLTPQRLWLIPGEKVSQLTRLSISKLQTHKWSQYEQPIDKVISCCDELKK